jgi:iron-sulfur cluster assembly accessory protein
MTMTAPTITESAAEHIQNMCKKHGVYAVSLSLKGGGCAGFEYTWGTKDKQDIEQKDTVIKTGTGNLVIDSFSMPFLENTEIDYVTEMLGTKLVVRNPNVQSACGCGESIGF